jgi:hypothetical protein
MKEQCLLKASKLIIASVYKIAEGICQKLYVVEKSCNSNFHLHILNAFKPELLLLLFYLDVPGMFPSELTWNYGFYKQTTGLFGRVISHIATQNNTNVEETRTDI